MISNVIGLCRICNQNHYLSIHGTELKEENLKLTVYNTTCNSCVEKIDFFSVKKLISTKNNLLMLNGKRKMILVDASTNTENNLYNKIQKNTFTNVLETGTKKSRSDTNTHGEGKTQRCLFCEFCSKEFTHTGDLNKHRRKHTGERPYDCSICNRKFSHTSNLARHQRLHSGEKPFVCPLKCGRNFSRKDKLSDHISKYHSNINK
ncbi:zinc finger protein 90-like [Leptopilina boulardi]|uniref:zinc finger protein 90-like n=1 Tax=Leptopilina boulardi TaxID=63433 RepID=UPI0021F68A4A|nr:zinc finger protein 90-like [Leptopilina boulardi]